MYIYWTLIECTIAIIKMEFKSRLHAMLLEYITIHHQEMHSYNVLCEICRTAKLSIYAVPAYIDYMQFETNFTIIWCFKCYQSQQGLI